MFTFRRYDLIMKDVNDGRFKVFHEVSEREITAEFIESCAKEGYVLVNVIVTEGNEYTLSPEELLSEVVNKKQEERVIDAIY